jgi:predicted transcriptional regulator
MKTLAKRISGLPNQALLTAMLGQLDEHVVEKRMKIFSDICSRLLDNIIQKEVIQERSLIDFSKQVLWIVNGVVEKLPESFERLADYITDYWRYELKKEQDSECKYSYIRLFQMINLVKTCYRGREQEKKALLALEEYKGYSELLCLLQRSPGITHKKLREQLEISSDKLSQQLEPLRKDGFLSSRHSGEEQYYMLTNDGEVLSKNLRLQESHNVWLDVWSNERILLFLIVLSKQKNGINGIQIYEIVQSVAKLSEDEICQIMRNFKPSRFSPQNSNYIVYNKDMRSVSMYHSLLEAGLGHPLNSRKMKQPMTEKGLSFTSKCFFLKNETDNLETNIWKTDKDHVFV